MTPPLPPLPAMFLLFDSSPSCNLGRTLKQSVSGHGAWRMKREIGEKRTIQSSKFRILRTSDLELSPVSLSYPASAPSSHQKWGLS